MPPGSGGVPGPGFPTPSSQCALKRFRHAYMQFSRPRATLFYCSQPLCLHLRSGAMQARDGFPFFDGNVFCRCASYSAVSFAVRPTRFPLDLPGLVSAGKPAPLLLGPSRFLCRPRSYYRHVPAEDKLSFSWVTAPFPPCGWPSSWRPRHTCEPLATARRFRFDSVPLFFVDDKQSIIVLRETCWRPSGAGHPTRYLIYTFSRVRPAVRVGVPLAL